MEQGSLKELLAQDGTFAAMWAEQVSSSDLGSIVVPEVKQEVSAYSVEDDAVRADLSDVAAQPSDEPPESNINVVAQDAIPTDPLLSPEQEGDENDATATQPPTFAPLAFPSTEEPAEDVSTSSPPGQPAVSDDSQEPQTPMGPGVTFETTSTPPRTGTPDPDGEPKRKRISSQNFQRLARRMSISTKRQGSISSMIPGLKKSESSPRASVDDVGSGSGRNSTDSPTSSVAGEGKIKNLKKDKKRKSQP